MKLVLGNKNYSSWSLRPWILAKQFGLEFDEQMVWLYGPNAAEQLLEASGSKKVPVLHDGELTVWDSLAICEYLNDTYLDGEAWPSDAKLKAKARAATAEMHSSFATLRQLMPMNCRQLRRINISDALQTDINRVLDIWQQALADSQGPWLFGEFSIADAFYAPIVLRFTTYQIAVPEVVQNYMDWVTSQPAMQQWLADSKAEVNIADAGVGEVNEAGEFVANL